MKLLIKKSGQCYGGHNAFRLANRNVGGCIGPADYRDTIVV